MCAQLRWITLGLILAAIAPQVGIAQDSSGADETAQRDGIERVASRLRRVLTKRAKDGRLSGAVLVARGADVVLHEGFGLADRQSGSPFRADAISTIGSITKQFTGAAILLLVEEGLVALDDPLQRFFDDLPEDKREITVHQLLTHTAGMSNILGSDEDFIGRDELMELCWRTPLDRSPGGRYAYSNLGYSVLGAIIEKVSKQPYEEFLSEFLFEPLELEETGYWIPDWDYERVAVGYRGGRRWGTVLDKQDPVQGPSWHLRCNGGIHSTLSDLHRWVLALQQDEILSAASRTALFARHVPERGGTHYGYGWSIAPLPSGHRLIGHNGGNGFFFANLEFFPDDGNWIAAVMINDPAFEDVVLDVRNAILAELSRQNDDAPSPSH